MNLLLDLNLDLQSVTWISLQRKGKERLSREEAKVLGESACDLGDSLLVTCCYCWSATGVNFVLSLYAEHNVYPNQYWSHNETYAR